jgi:prepilin-type N-terminal cleavage/methylation domain-containing protein
VTRRAFTLIEMVVAVAIMAVVVVMAGTIFRVGIKAYRLAMAHAEIMRTYRTVVDQLNMDFRGLTKEGEIVAIWAAEADGQRRMDRIMFHATGDFCTYHNVPPVRGNTARISYMLSRYDNQSVLARTQHILVDQPGAFLDVNDLFDSTQDLSDEELFEWHNRHEYDNVTLKSWIDIPFEKKMNFISMIADVNGYGSTVNAPNRGAHIDLSATSHADRGIHMLVAQRVDYFAVQGWLPNEQRWYPIADPDGDGILEDSDFRLTTNGTEIDPKDTLGMIYPKESWRSAPSAPDDVQTYTADQFNDIKGLGRALKFTFKVYDSFGLIENGRTFTHMVFLDH